MKKKLTEFQVTIGYKAVITVDVKAENQEEARKRHSTILMTIVILEIPQTLKMIAMRLRGF